MNEYISLDDILCSNTIYITGGIEGVFFICIDPWDIPEENKEWWKFSTNPFDIDFMKFVSLGTNFINAKTRNGIKDLDTMFRYFKVFSNEVASLKNATIIHKVFFTDGKIQEVLKENKNIKVTSQYIYNIKSKLRSIVITWLSNLFQEFNVNTNNMEYFQKYYNDWIRLVDKIQTMPREKYNIIWRFIRKNNIRSYNDFAIKWKMVIKNDVMIRGLSKYDKIKIGIMFDVNGVLEE